MNRCFYLLASALFFFACSDDNGTSSSENAETAEYQQVTIDKKNHRITVNQDAHTEEYCILQQWFSKFSVHLPHRQENYYC